MAAAPIHGTVEPGFEPVRDAFAKAFEAGDVGAAVSAYVDGHQVVDLHGGWADAARTREWAPDTIVNVFSATKGMTATCAHRLVEAGRLELDERVAAYWPQFAQNGKGDITVRMLLNHRAGLPYTNAPYPPEQRWDWDVLTDALARSSPHWSPGTKVGYHGGSFGYLVGEILRRIDGRPLHDFFRDEIAAPLGADFLIRVGPEHDHRCAEMLGPEDMVGSSNARVWRDAADGAATGMGTADGLARVFAALARGGELGGVRVLAPSSIEAASRAEPLPGGEEPTEHFGLGYELLWKRFPGLPAGTFGHTGMGGSIGLADPGRKLGFGFVMNNMPSNGAATLLPAIYQSLFRA